MPISKYNKIEKHLISKTSFIKSLQCEKQLFLYKNRYFLRDKLTQEQIEKFKKGHEVGKIAWKLFPNGVDASPKSPMQTQKAILKTQELIDENEKVVYEASFSFNRSMCILDVLTVEPNKLLAYEVKSSYSISQTFIYDAAYQYFIMTGGGYKPTDFFLVYLNEGYNLENEIDYRKMFKIESILPQIIELQPFISAKVERAKEIVMLSHSPEIAIGQHCEIPYKCDFFGFCRRIKQ